MGLLDLLKSNDPAVAQGLLQAGLSLLSSKGKFGNALGGAGLAGLQGANQYKQMQFQRQLQESQLDDMKRRKMQQAREDDLANLPGKFIVPPSQPGMDATGGMETALEAPQNQSSPTGRMDMPGLAQALMAAPGGFQQGLGLQQSLKRQAPQLQEIDPTKTYGTWDGDKFKEAMKGAPKEKDIDPNKPFMVVNGKIVPNPAYQAYAKDVARSGSSSIVNYGSPVPVELPGGGVGYVQPSNRGGPAAPMLAPGGTPLRKPKDETTKMPTESERTAGFLLQRIRDSQRQLKGALRDSPSAASPSVLPEAVRLVSEPAANAITVANRQRVESAQLDILDAALTLGTGAAYTKEQLQGYRKSYFPQLGDSALAVKDKSERLNNLIRAAETKAGRSAKDTASGGVRAQADAILRGE